MDLRHIQNYIQVNESLIYKSCGTFELEMLKSKNALENFFHHTTKTTTSPHIQKKGKEEEVKTGASIKEIKSEIIPHFSFLLLPSTLPLLKVYRLKEHVNLVKGPTASLSIDIFLLKTLVMS
ncbi:unnamed protein product [Cunninghamella echinulata]